MATRFHPWYVLLSAIGPFLHSGAADLNVLHQSRLPGTGPGRICHRKYESTSFPTGQVIQSVLERDREPAQPGGPDLSLVRAPIGFSIFCNFGDMHMPTHGFARNHRLRHDRRVSHPGDQRDPDRPGASPPTAGTAANAEKIARLAQASARSTTTWTRCWPIPASTSSASARPAAPTGSGRPGGARRQARRRRKAAGNHPARCDAIIDACDAAGVRLCTIFPSRFTRPTSGSRKRSQAAGSAASPWATPT